MPILHQVIPIGGIVAVIPTMGTIEDAQNDFMMLNSLPIQVAKDIKDINTITNIHAARLQPDSVLFQCLSRF